MIDLVVSGGQTGVDQSAWRAAESCGIRTGGWMPRGYRTEDGSRIDLAARYDAGEHPSDEYPPRTEANVRMADVTLWFGSGDSFGYGCTIKACRKAGRPFQPVTLDQRPESVAAYLKIQGAHTLNIAGNRASKSPAGFGEAVERWLVEMFAALGHAPASPANYDQAPIEPWL